MPVQTRSHSVRSAGVRKLRSLAAQACSASTRGAQGSAPAYFSRDLSSAFDLLTRRYSLVLPGTPCFFMKSMVGLRGSSMFIEQERFTREAAVYAVDTNQ